VRPFKYAELPVVAFCRLTGPQKIANHGNARPLRAWSVCRGSRGVRRSTAVSIRGRLARFHAFIAQQLDQLIDRGYPVIGVVTGSGVATRRAEFAVLRFGALVQSQLSGSAN